MARHVMIFCQNDKVINFTDLAEFIKDSWFFDKCPEFNTGQNFIEITYDPNLRPISIELFDDPKIVEEIKKERCEENMRKIGFDSIVDENKKYEIAAFTTGCENIYDIEFSLSYLSENCWAMMACIESFIAKEKKGIIFAEEGIYDENLQLTINF